jgi:hypothetical protein
MEVPQRGQSTCAIVSRHEEPDGSSHEEHEGLSHDAHEIPMSLRDIVAEFSVIIVAHSFVAER